MKITLSTDVVKPKATSYPRLMKSKAGSVVLMLEEGKGVYLTGARHAIPVEVGNWGFVEDYDGTVCLKNDDGGV
mgnify:CR=1 FL=1